MSDCGKDKKIIIILSITCGFLLLFLLISGALNYKQNNEKTSCSSNLQAANTSLEAANSGLQNAQLAKSNLQNLHSSLQSAQDSEKKVLENQKEKVRQLYYIINNITTDGDNLNKGQISCMLNKLFEKHTPFDITYDVVHLLLGGTTSDNPEIREWALSDSEKSQEIKKATCQAAKSCNFSNSSELMKSCTLYNI
jgi:hypothetical protein